MNKKKFILDLHPKDLSQMISPSFRAKQICHWIYKKYTFDFEQMLNIPQALRQKLNNDFCINWAKILQKQSSNDGSVKYLIGFGDGHSVEAVLLKMSDEVRNGDKIFKEAKYSLCVSTQVGCKMGCTFCLTGKSGFERNLGVGEIVSQILLVKKDMNFAQNKTLNIVYMGMGEPLDNLENLAKAIEIIACEDTLSIGKKRQTISTSGLSKEIYALNELDLGVHLAISLHATTDEIRNKLIPINRKYPIQSIIDALKNFKIDLRKRLMFEYIMIDEINDSLEDAKRLNVILQGIKAKVNLIYFNPFEGTKFKRPSEKKMLAFKNYLNNKGLTCTIRQSRGLDISAACGQLKEQSKNNQI